MYGNAEKKGVTGEFDVGSLKLKGKLQKEQGLAASDGLRCAGTVLLQSASRQGKYNYAHIGYVVKRINERSKTGMGLSGL